MLLWVCKLHLELEGRSSEGVAFPSLPLSVILTGKAGWSQTLQSLDGSLQSLAFILETLGSYGNSLGTARNR